MTSMLHDTPDNRCVGMYSTFFDDMRKGCGRTVDEGSNRIFMNDDEKSAIWARIRREQTEMRFRRDGR
ncbi:DUF1289 domain-containing protein [Burkholderia pseudomultivorans]|uniref:DUF1289 domain-containing protein n=1 Tax=Burkholderia pseudomultivorans TaxID=1207504 RepID=UPI0001FD7873|nr:DUF1289 domain-containing protein [Burkholderia pseudomultivorans]EGD00499.1 hypothetical protein B1M_31262 [Burkholderia sp. TJI49]MDS0790864.1 DUF1289 domain-containing protein [Burkholderia pseudomultivorans]